MERKEKTMKQQQVLNTEKQYKEKTAKILYKLEAGKSACFVDMYGNVIRTSPVQAIFTIHFGNGEGFAIFDTANTRYTVIFQHYFVG